MEKMIAKPSAERATDTRRRKTASNARRRSTAAFSSILFDSADAPRPEDDAGQPEFFVDLNCDQIVQAVVAGREEYRLEPFFRTPLHNGDTIKYRHAVMQDLEEAPVHECICDFTNKLRNMRQHLDRSRKFVPNQKETAFLESAEIYCEAVISLATDLSKASPRSRGFRGLMGYLNGYINSGPFIMLRSQTAQIRADLDAIRYCVLAKGDSFTVRKYEGESDYSAEIELDFQKFQQGAVADYLTRFSTTEDMNHVESKILEFVAKLHPEVFRRLTQYRLDNDGYLDKAIAMFDREVQFYQAYLDYVQKLKRAGLHFCYPDVSIEDTKIYDREGFDVALARKLVEQGAQVVCNDFSLSGKERILVISGPNQGGKTTFARAFGQMHFLASIGCPVPGTKAKLRLFDHLFTHFEKQERVENLRGKLEDDLVRISNILDRATSRSVIVMNEIFNSTTIRDEIFLSKKIMEELSRLDLLGAWVTFVDELASYGPQTVSMVSTVVPEDPTLRTFKIVRQAADGLAYAMAIVRKHRLTYGAILERIKA